jgi:hypothetical protein
MSHHVGAINLAMTSRLPAPTLAMIFPRLSRMALLVAVVSPGMVVVKTDFSAQSWPIHAFGSLPMQMPFFD